MQKFISKFLDNLKVIYKNNNSLVSKFYIIIEEIDKAIKNQFLSIDISFFVYLFCTKHSNFFINTQNDALEFIRVFLEDLSNEFNKIKNKPPYHNLNLNEKINKSEKSDGYHAFYLKYENSLIVELFYSQIIYIYTCACNNIEYAFQKILDIPLLFPEKNSSYNIHDLLNYYFKLDYIDFESICTKCKKISKHKQEIKICRIPEIFIISLQRIDYLSRTKNESFVTFPYELDISPYIDKECLNNKEMNYIFYNSIGVINHKGFIDFGHYTSFMKNKNNLWYVYDDSKVEILKENIINKDAYILFYLKK